MQKTTKHCPAVGKGDGEKRGQVFFSLEPMSKAVNSQKALQRLATRGVAVMVQPEAGKHVTVVTLAGEVDTASRFSYRKYWRDGPVELVGQSLSSGFWGSMILTWVNGKRPLRPFTSPSHWPLMFIRVTMTMSPTWGQKDRRPGYRTSRGHRTSYSLQNKSRFSELHIGIKQTVRSTGLPLRWVSDTDHDPDRLKTNALHRD